MATNTRALCGTDRRSNKPARDLTPSLADSFINLSEDAWKRRGKVLARQQQLTQGYGLSYLL